MQTWSKNSTMLSFHRLACVAGAFLLLIGGFDRAAARPSAVVPHVLELFTAQGCTGCAEADQAIKGVIGRPNVLVLAFPVDYWDYLGWKDTFARPEFTQRQAAYKSRFKLRETYSPQLVIDGRSEGAGVDMARIDSASASASAAAVRRTVKLRASRGRVRVSGRAPQGGADIPRTSRSRSSPAKTAARPFPSRTSSGPWSSWDAGTDPVRPTICRRRLMPP